MAFTLDYDSAAKPSKISLPTMTVIDVSSVGVYDASYPGGSLVSTPIAGATLYVRSVVSDPFGSYDITSVNVSIDGPGVSGDISTTLIDSSVVANDGCAKIYEYVWHTTANVGAYNITVTANEGTEGVTDSAATAVQLTFLDLGTPGTAEFTSGNNATVTNAFPANQQICVRVTDLDQNLNATVVETVTAVISSSSGDLETLTLSETGTNTGIFTACVAASTSAGAGANSGTLNAPVGSVLTLTYTDPNDTSDQATATATVLPAAGTPGATMSKTLVSPADGQAGIGETVQFGLQVINTGSTTLTNVSVTDTFPTNRLSFVSASLAPTTASGSTLTWANVGPLTPGQSTNILVSFIATGTASPAVNFATANAGGSTTNTSSVGVTITHAALTITKTLLSPTNGTVNIGSNATFRIVVQNTGDTPIPSVPLEDTFSASCYEFVSATVTPDGVGAGSLLWNDITGAGSLATNASLTLDVTLKVVGGCDPANNTARSDYAVDAHGDPVPSASSTVGVTTGAGRITGTVYNDADQSGTLTPGDSGLSNVQVELYSDPNGDGDPSDGTLVRLVNTDASGAYELLNLTTGAYVVVETDLPGYASVAPLNNRLSVVLATLTTNANNDFFDYLVPSISYATINGTVWADTNANGIVDGGDYGLANVTVELIQDVNTNGFADIGETVAASITTDANGTYSFFGVAPGYYVVRETDLFGWLSTADTRPPNDNQIGLYVAAGTVTNGNDFLDNLPPPIVGNHPPVANNDTYSTLEDTTLNIAAPGVLVNDTDVDGDPLTAVLVSPPTHGTLSLNANGAFTYTPNTNYNGSDSFTYRANDGTTNSGLATVNLTITAVDDAPVATADTYSTLKNLALNVSAPGVLANDTDVENDALSALLVATVTHGTLVLNATGGFIYTPASNYVGGDGFTYRAYDAGATGNVATVTLTILATNTPPVANGQSVSTVQNTAKSITLTGSDPNGDALTFATVALPANGTLSGLNTNTGAIIYTPNPGFIGADSFTFRVNDGLTNSTPATVNISVGAQADLAVYKSGPTNFTVGSNLTFTITTTNLGPSTATNVVVRDQLPAGYTFVSAVPPGAAVSNNLVSWPALTLSALGRTNFSVTVLAISVGNFTNIAFSTAGTPDPNPSNNDGTALNSQVTTVVAPGASPLFDILQGTNAFNPQTGLFEQRVTVTNISAFTIAAVQLLVDNIHGTNGVPRTNVFLYNATGTNVDLRPYVQYNSSLNPGSNATLILEFCVPDRKPFTNSLEAVAVLPVGGGTNNGTILLIRTNFFDLRIAGEPRYVIEFDSIPNRTYTVQYSNDGMATWSNAVPSITANANRTQWYDDGPPKTDSKPMSVPSRFYRLLLAP